MSESEEQPISDDDLGVVVCDLTAHRLIAPEGAIARPCSQCGAQVWLTRETSERVDMTIRSTVCYGCFVLLATFRPGMAIPTLSRRTAYEMEEWLRQAIERRKAYDASGGAIDDDDPEH